MFEYSLVPVYIHCQGYHLFIPTDRFHTEIHVSRYIRVSRAAYRVNVAIRFNVSSAALVRKISLPRYDEMSITSHLTRIAMLRLPLVYMYIQCLSYAYRDTRRIFVRNRSYYLTNFVEQRISKSRTKFENQIKNRKLHATNIDTKQTTGVYI